MGLVAVALSTFLLAASDATVSHTYVVPAPTLTIEGEAVRVALADCPSAGLPGDPALPVAFARIALPPGATVATASVAFGAQTRISIPRRVAAYQAAVAGETTTPRVAASPAAAPASSYPARPWRLLGVSRKHGVSIALIAFHPVTYYPENLELAYARKVEVSIALRDNKTAASCALLPEDRADLAAVVDNPETLPAATKSRKDGDDAAYVVICPPGYEDAFAPLTAMHAATGVSTRTVTTAWVYANYAGLRPDGQVDDATRIRNFLAEAYAQWNTRHVLLAGDADSLGTPLLPMRYLQTSLYPTRIPSDVYYGCLDGTFDGNADGIYGEDGDGEDGGVVDLFFELHVGRAPVDSLQDAQSFVAKAIAYEHASSDSLRRALLVGERLGQGLSEWGGDLLDHILQGSNADACTTGGFGDTEIGAFYTVGTLYDRSYPGNQWPPDVVESRIDEGVQLVAHVGHGDVGGVMRLDAAAAQALANELGFVLYSESCHAGAIDNQDAAGEIMPYDSIVEELLGAPHAATACIANTRNGWVDPNIVGGPSHRFHRYFWDRVLARGVFRLAEAHDASKEACAPYATFDAQGRWCYYSLTTFGDPRAIIKCAGSSGLLSVNRPYYFPADAIEITVIDKDLDLDPMAQNTAQATIRAERSGASAQVTLPESGTATGVFRGSIPLAAGQCPVTFSPPDTIQVTYHDADTGQGVARDVTQSRPFVLPLTVLLPEDLTGTIVTVSAGRPVVIVPQTSGGKPPYTFDIVDEDDYIVQATTPCPLGVAEPRDWHADDRYWRDSLPFPFPFYGEEYTTVKVSSNGFIDFGTIESGHHYASENSLRVHLRIAVVWRDLTTEGNSGIYYTEGEDFCGFLWRGVEDYHNQTRLDARVLLFKDGRICMWRDPPDGSVCGISAGDGVRFVSLGRYPELIDAPYIEFSPAGIPAGLTFDPATGTVSGPPRRVGTYHLLLRVRDAVGQEVEKPLRLQVVPNPLAIVQPRGGDFLHVGDVAGFQWTSTLAGGTVELRYNTDGSLTTFPFPVASGVSHAAGTYSWTIANTKSDTCRLLVRAENEDVRVVSELFAIAGPRILLSSPKESDVWIGGQTVNVTWRSLGAPGARVSLWYNTTGSTTDFPILMAAGIQNTGSFAFAVPDMYAAKCRVKIASDSVPEIVDVSGVFTIRTPYFTITSPASEACLLAGAVETIRWENAGATGTAVTLRYNTTGDSTVFPYVITPTPVPNTGAFEWTVPDIVAPYCRLGILSADRPGTEAMSSLFAIGNDCRRTIVLWTPYIDEGEEEISGTLRALGAVRPDLQIVYSENATPDLLAADLADAGAMVIVQQEDYPAGFDFVALGTTLAPLLERFMALGGAVVVCNQERDSELFLPATGFMQTELVDVAASGSCEVVDPQDPLCRHVSPQFSGPTSTAWYRVTGPGVRTVLRHEDAAVAACRDIGFGWVVLLGFDFFQRNLDTSHLLCNAVLPPFVREGVRFFAPDGPRRIRPGERVMLKWAQKGVAVDRSLLSYSLDGSATEFPYTLSVALADGIGELAWSPPALPPDTHFVCRFKAAPEGVPDLAEALPHTVYVSHALAVTPTALPELSLGLPYDQNVHIEGGVPPFTLEVFAIPEGLLAAKSDERTIRIHGMLSTGAGVKTVWLRVLDAVGDMHETTLALTAVRRTLQLLAPVGGEHYLAGSTFQVRWQKTGYLGTTVTVAYNTTGSATEFPLVIAERQPIGQGIAWTVPDADLPIVRLAVTSDEFPAFRSVSGVFGITPPTLRVLAPAAYRCLEPDGAGEITWISVGNPSGSVTIRYNTDGSETEFPFTVVANTPDTGRFTWRIGAVAFDTCRVQVCSSDGSLCAVSQGTFRVASQCGLQALFIGRYSDGERMLAASNAFLAQEPDLNAEMYVEMPDAGRLADLDVLIFCPETETPGATPTADGLFLNGAGIASFIARGGALIVCAPGDYTAECLHAAGVLAAGDFLADCADDEFDTVDPIHPLGSNLPPRFTAPPRSGCIALQAPGFLPICASPSGAYVSVAHLGDGWVVALAADMANVTPEVAQIIRAALRPAAVPAGLALLGPRPNDVFLAGAAVPITWVQHGVGGPCALEYDLEGGDTFEHTLTTVTLAAARGSYLWQNLPVPPEGDYYRCRLRARSLQHPEGLYTMPAPFFIARGLVLAVEAPAEVIEETDYAATLRAGGGMPPYEFFVTGLPRGLNVAPNGATAVVSGRVPHGEPPADVLAVVRDQVGSEASVTFRIAARAPRITLITPAAAATFVCGDTVTVRWQADANIGETVHVAYNTDGSPTEFPFVIAPAAPAGAEYLWQLPQTSSAACRLVVRGTGVFGHVAAVSQIFRIMPPQLSFLTPCASQCVRAGRPFTLTWDSIGNWTGVVTVRANRDGAADDFPETLATNVADEGRLVWQAPDAAFPAVRFAIENGDGSLRTVSPRFSVAARCAVKGVLWIPFLQEDQGEVVNSIASITLTEHDFQWVYSRDTEPLGLARTLAGAQTLIILEQERAHDVDFALLGATLAPVLRQFLDSGNTVVFCKQVGAGNALFKATGLLDVTFLGQHVDLACQVDLPLHPVVDGVPGHFTTAATTAWYKVDDPGAVVLARSPARGAVVVAKEVGLGRVVLIGSDYNLYTEASARVLANSVRMVPFGQRTRFVRGDVNQDGTVDMGDAISIVSYLFINGPRPRCLDAADINDDAYLGTLTAVNVADPLYLLRYLFVRGPCVPPPFRSPSIRYPMDCGLDPQLDDGVDCESYDRCK